MDPWRLADNFHRVTNTWPVASENIEGRTRSHRRSKAGFDEGDNEIRLARIGLARPVAREPNPPRPRGRMS
ncbi:hypothetical protein SSAG_05060 [Streptomyces sp. Mg1]|nr:hypothetical protein SSAG_05060 [Streptomyces sp. Mg1]